MNACAPLLAVVFTFLALGCSREETVPQATLTVAGALGSGGTEGFARATEVRAFRFPEDHGPHPEFRTEWWYFTGNLNTEEGRRLGYQFTLFRNALVPKATARPSRWAASQFYMGHFAVSDVGGERFYAFDRFSREALGLAGAQGAPFRVWLEDWQVAAVGTAALPARLRAAQAGVEIDLEVAAGKPPVLQGNRGLSQKSAEAGNASYYYSLTRMPTAGQVRIGNEVFAVQGESWMDREWSTSALGSDQVGWDWFSLQLSDGTELMYYQLRKADGTRDPFSRATWVDASDRSLTLDPQQIRLQILSNWQSPHSQVRYPSGWLLTVPTQELELTVTPLLKDQELNLAVRYWEGAVRVEGTRGGKPVQGNGYVELTGYGDERGAGPQRH